MEFKNGRRKNIKYKSGDYFRFKIDRNNYGFGRILIDVNKIRKKKLISGEHGLNLPMGPPLLIQLFAFQSTNKEIEIIELDTKPRLPSDIMMDNVIFYGEYEIIGHRDLDDEEFEFPISYGKAINQRQIVFLQWGFIHKELPKSQFNKYLVGENASKQNPYGYYSIGFSPHYDTKDILETINNRGEFDFEKSTHYIAECDLRNPKNLNVKAELFQVFGLDIKKSYIENSKLTNTPLPSEYLKKIQ